jgi:hypothetical protein
LSRACLGKPIIFQIAINGTRWTKTPRVVLPAAT